MDIWLVQTGEELPMDGAATRLLRTALLARTLAERGHRVTYWNAAFNHQAKQMRPSGNGRVRQEGRYDAILLPGRAYAKNVSLTRIRSQRENAASFARMARAEAKPDVILCGFPTIELASAVRDYARTAGVPYVIDARDMWPEVIETHLPAAAGFVAAPLLAYWRAERDAAFRDAAAIVGVSSMFVEWACRNGSRTPTERDRAFFLAADTSEHTPAVIAAAHAYWDNEIGPASANCTTVFMAGNLSARVDIMTAVNAAVQLPTSDAHQFRLVVCGKGDLESQIGATAAASANVHFAGWRNGAELRALAERSAAGVLAYANTADLTASFPNKVGEYLSYGLPVMTPLHGEVRRQLSPRGLLITYDEGSVASAIAAYQAIMAGLPPETAQAAKACFSDLFDPVRIYAEFADHLEHVAKGSPNG